MLPEPDRIVAAVSALAGGVFWGLFHLATTILAGQPPSAWDLTRAVANVVCGFVAGGLLAYFVGPALASLIPWPAFRDLHAVGFGIGMLAWELAPAAFTFAKNLAAKRAASVTGGQS